MTTTVLLQLLERTTKYNLKSLLDPSLICYFSTMKQRKEIKKPQKDKLVCKVADPPPTMTKSNKQTPSQISLLFWICINQAVANRLRTMIR